MVFDVLAKVVSATRVSRMVLCLFLKCTRSNSFDKFFVFLSVMLSFWFLFLFFFLIFSFDKLKRKCDRALRC